MDVSASGASIWSVASSRHSDRTVGRLRDAGFQNPLLVGVKAVFILHLLLHLRLFRGSSGVRGLTGAMVPTSARTA
jgi:hypothetical protein